MIVGQRVSALAFKWRSICAMNNNPDDVDSESSRASNRYTVLGARGLDGDAAAFIRDADLKRHEIALRPEQYKSLFGRRLGADDKSDPAERGVLRVRVPGASPMFLRYRGCGKLKAGEALVHPWTADRLRSLAKHCEANDPLVVECADAGRWIGPFWHYWQHPDDAARVSFKVGIVGLVFAVLALVGEKCF